MSSHYWSHIDRVAKNFCCNVQLPNQKLQHTRQQSIKASKRLFKALPVIPSSHVGSIGSHLFLPKRSESLSRSIMPFITFSLKNRTWTPNNPCKKNPGLVTEPPFLKGTGLIVRVSSLHQHRQGLVSDGYQFGGNNKPWLLEILQNCTNLRHVHPCSMLILARRNKHGSFLGLATQRSISLFFAKITWEIEDSVIGQILSYIILGGWWRWCHWFSNCGLTHPSINSLASASAVTGWVSQIIIVSYALSIR